MTSTIYIHQPEKSVSFIRLPNFLFEAPTFTPLSNEAKILYAFILRRTGLSRKNSWTDKYGRTKTRRYGITHAAAYIKILFVFCKRDFHILSIDDCFLFALRAVEREVS